VCTVGHAEAFAPNSQANLFPWRNIALSLIYGLMIDAEILLIGINISTKGKLVQIKELQAKRSTYDQILH